MNDTQLPVPYDQMKRPVEYDEALATEICEKIADGGNLNVLCRERRYPSRTTVYRWLEKHPKFRDAYARARETRADYRFDRINEIEQELRDGKISWHSARLEIDSIKWQAGKERPKYYGDKVVHSGDEDNPVVVKNLDKRDQAVLDHFLQQELDKKTDVE